MYFRLSIVLQYKTMKTYFFYLKEIYQNLLHEFYNSESFENEILHVFYYDN